MKRLTIVLLSMVLAVGLSSAVFGAGKPVAPPPPPPPFVEGTAPGGKVLVYVYSPGGPTPEPKAGESLFGPLLSSKSGPIGVMKAGSYCSLITDPGTIKFWLSASRVAELKLEALAGQIYYVRADCWSAGIGNPMLITELKLIPNEKAKTEIAECWQLTE